MQTWYFSMKLDVLTTGGPGTGTGSRQQLEFLPHMALVHCMGLSKYLNIARLFSHWC